MSVKQTFATFHSKTLQFVKKPSLLHVERLFNIGEIAKE